MESTDSELWAAVGEGDERAFGRLFDRHARPIYNFAFRRTANWSAAEDIVAIVFMEAWRRRHEVQFAGESALPWLYGVATNVLRNHQRARLRYGKALDRLAAPGADPGFEEDVIGRLNDQEVMMHLLDVLRELPLRDQEVVVLCLWEGLSYEEAAIALNVPVGTVRSRLSRARTRLQYLVGELTGFDGHERSGRPSRPPAAREEYT